MPIIGPKLKKQNAILNLKSLTVSARISTVVSVHKVYTCLFLVSEISSLYIFHFKTSSLNDVEP